MHGAIAAFLFFSQNGLVHSCQTAQDCGLLGDCDVASGTCICDPGWTSDNCTKLEFLPAGWGPSNQAYMTNYSSWGGNAVKGPDGQYHLFFDEMRQDGLHQYQINSQSIHAVSSSLFGPFTKKRTLRAPLSHNTQPFFGDDGSVFIFMISGEPGAKEPHGPLIVGRADDPNAEFEWIFPKMYFENGTELIYPAFHVDNPTGIVRRNGSVLLMVRGSAMFTAPSWDGPYTMFTEDALGCGQRKKECSVEDPFIWASPRGLHMLAHDHEPFEYHKQVTAYAFTADKSGRSGWTFSWWPAAEARNHSFSDGTKHTFCSQQRPALHFSELPKNGVQHGRPLAFFSGAQHGPLTEKTQECGFNSQNASEWNPYPDYSFTMVLPVAGGASFVV